MAIGYSYERSCARKGAQGTAAIICGTNTNAYPPT